MQLAHRAFKDMAAKSNQAEIITESKRNHPHFIQELILRKQKEGKMYLAHYE